VAVVVFNGIILLDEMRGGLKGEFKDRGAIVCWGGLKKIKIKK
jgi:hypothetical protein